MRCLWCLSLSLICAAQDHREAINQAWSEVLGQTTTVKVAPAHPDDFLNHLFLESRTEYTREQTSFTGLPSLTGVINAVPGSLANPAGIPLPGAFQPDANSLYEFLDFGTRGWLSPHVDTNFSLRYRQELTAVDPASPSLDLLTTYQDHRRVDLLGASVYLHGAGMDLRLGRQYVYGAELASLDGASFSINRPGISVTLYAGRRFSLFNDQDQRAMGGGNFRLRLGEKTSLEYDSLLYVKASHLLTYRRRIQRDWFLTTYFRAVGGAPVDFSSQLLYLSPTGKTTARVAFLQKLTNKDFVYDYTFALQRLNLGVISPYTQVVADLHQTIVPRLRVGGLVWIRRLNDAADQSAFNTSFEDYRVNAQVFPLRNIETSFDFHEHHSDRSQAFSAALFDDISRAGETRIQDLTAEVRRAFAEGRLSIAAGGYYRRLNFQDQFQMIHNAHDRGLLGSFWYRVTPQTRAWFDYSLDTDFSVFRPDIRHSTVLRVGLDWKY